ncbi:hypothetical protein ACFY1P_15565 [Streptomyces sp. NPDC001407]|uniref:hypothetical protein n=1 Tax=Streptomyces sp. NPDC001407 TaxID=3364573 RepID=UPI0036C10DD1
MPYLIGWFGEAAKPIREIDDDVFTGPSQEAAVGPLVAVTLHQRGFHALLVTSEGVDAVPLPGVTREQAGDWASKLAEATAEAVRQVLTEL